MRFMLKYN